MKRKYFVLFFALLILPVSACGSETAYGSKLDDRTPCREQSDAAGNGNS